jgi:hypothetical protein
MNKNITKLIAIATIVLIPVVSLAQSSTPASSPASVPVSQPSSGTGISTGNPSAGTSSTGNPSAGTSSTGNPSAGTNPSTGNPSAGTSAPTTPSTPPSTPTNDGSSTGPSSSGSRPRNSNTSITSYGCPMITSFMKYGANNDSAQVTKLQSFLKNIEKLDVDVTGYFDKKTENAVIAFQNKYNPTIMGPWGATKGTGFVYITTVKQINKITCSLPLTLNASELSIINARRNYVATNNVVKVQPVVNVAPTIPLPIEIEVTGNDSETITFETDIDTNEDNTATVGKASIMSRFWKFFSGMFK